MKTFFSRLTQLSVIFSAFASIFVSAEAQLTSLKVESDVVYFTTAEAKSGTRPSCMASENSELWSLSLTTATGKAIYPLLVAASTDRRPITVHSANDCSDAEGFERVAGIELGQQALSSFAGGQGKAIYLFKADGVTKVGRFVAPFQDRSDQFSYLPIEGVNYSTRLHVYQPNKGISQVYFKAANCTGTPYFTQPSRVGRNRYINSGKFFKSGDEAEGKGYQSSYRYANSRISCNNSGNSTTVTYPLDFSQGDDLCGEHLCVLREE
ncbi:hypothetical protein [Thalassotalea ganghwensis]